MSIYASLEVLIEYYHIQGLGEVSGCSTAVEHIPWDQKVVGLNAAPRRAFSFSFFLYLLLGLLNQVPRGGASQLITHKCAWLLSLGQTKFNVHKMSCRSICNGVQYFKFIFNEDQLLFQSQKTSLLSRWGPSFNFFGARQRSGGVLLG